MTQAISSTRILLTSDGEPLFVGTDWRTAGFTEPELLVQFDDIGNQYAIICRVCGLLYLEDPDFEGKCPRCGYDKSKQGGRV